MTDIQTNCYRWWIYLNKTGGGFTGTARTVLGALNALKDALDARPSLLGMNIEIIIKRSITHVDVTNEDGSVELLRVGPHHD